MTLNMEEIQSYADQIKSTYRRSMDVLLRFSNHEIVVHCDDEQFEIFLKERHSLKDLQACIYLLERHVDLQREIINSLGCLQELHKYDHLPTEYNSVLGKTLAAQSKLATLRSRIVRCLTKQIQLRYKDPLIQLPAWSIKDTWKTSTPRIESHNELFIANNRAVSEDKASMKGRESENESPGNTLDIRTATRPINEVAPDCEVESAYEEVNQVIQRPQKSVADRVKELTIQDEGEQNLEYNELTQGVYALLNLKDVVVDEKNVVIHQEESANETIRVQDDKEIETGSQSDDACSRSYAEMPESNQQISMPTKSSATTWDPSLLIKDILGHTKRLDTNEKAEDEHTHEIQMAGYLEKLPVNKKKASFVKAWRKRYFRIMNGKLFYFEDHRANTPISFIKLADCTVAELALKCLEVKESRENGDRLLVLRCATSPELEDWKEALENQSKLKESRPAFELPNEKKTVVMIDFGSSSIKAGLLDGEVWPQLLIPSVYAIDKDDSKKMYYGYDALSPSVRERSKLVHPLRAAAAVGKSTLDPNELIGFIAMIFKELNTEPIHHQVIATLPVNLREQDKNRLVEVFLAHFQVESIYMSPQAILSMYSYSAISGIVVNVGNSIEIVPIEDGYVVASGVMGLPYGGRQVTDSFARMLSSSGHRYFSEIENYIAEYLKVKTCYISQDFEKEMDEELTLEVDMGKYELPNGDRWVKVDKERVAAFEGLFNPHLYGKDTPGLHKLVYQAVMACSIDSRKHMCRNIYLSGGTTKVQGFAERLETELSTKCFPSMPIKVHASHTRQFAAFSGAAVLASLQTFQDMCVTCEEWEELGADVLRKWDHF